MYLAISGVAGGCLGALRARSLAQEHFAKNICCELVHSQVHHSRGRYWANTSQWDLIRLPTALFGKQGSFRHQAEGFKHLSWLGLDKCQVPTKTAPSLPLLSWTGKRKCDERLVGRDKDRERSLTSCHHEQNRLNLGRK